jgi:hypothetical protein
MERKGVILEVGPNYTTILSECGEFKNIKKMENHAVGQEIIYKERRAIFHKIPGVYAAAAVLLVAVASFLVPSFISASRVVAYVSLEMVPSVEFAVDDKGRVTEVVVHDDRAKNIINDLDFQKKDINDVASEVTKRAIQAGKKASTEKNEILISVVSTGNSDKNNKEQSSKLEKDLKQATETKLKEENIQAKIEVLNTDEEVRQQAQKLGLSTGKYVILMKAREQGIDVNPEDLKTMDIEDAIEKAGGNPDEIIQKAAGEKTAEYEDEITEDQNSTDKGDDQTVEASTGTAMGTGSAIDKEESTKTELIPIE